MAVTTELTARDELENRVALEYKLAAASVKWVEAVRVLAVVKEGGASLHRFVWELQL